MGEEDKTRDKDGQDWESNPQQPTAWAVLFLSTKTKTKNVRRMTKTKTKFTDNFVSKYKLD